MKKSNKNVILQKYSNEILSIMFDEYGYVLHNLKGNLDYVLQLLIKEVVNEYGNPSYKEVGKYG